ncbi:hypothetical protein IC575_021506 [Cucumis melo]
MNNKNGIAICWLGHLVFRDKVGCKLFVRCMPTCFKTFSIVLVDEDEIARVDVPF